MKRTIWSHQRRKVKTRLPKRIWNLPSQERKIIYNPHQSPCPLCITKHLILNYFKKKPIVKLTQLENWGMNVKFLKEMKIILTTKSISMSERLHYFNLCREKWVGVTKSHEAGSNGHLEKPSKWGGGSDWSNIFWEGICGERNRKDASVGTVRTGNEEYSDTGKSDSCQVANNSNYFNCRRRTVSI